MNESISNLDEGKSESVDKSVEKKYSKRLTKSSLKKLFKFIIRANKKLKNDKALNMHHEKLGLHNEISLIKNKLKQRADVNKIIKEKKSIDFFDEMQTEKEKSHGELKKAIFNIQGSNILKNNGSKKSVKKSVVAKKKIVKKSKVNIDEKKVVNKEIVPNLLKALPNFEVDPILEQKKKNILKIKEILKSLEIKHKELEDSNDHEPVLIHNVEEKIKLLKSRIHSIEYGN